MKTIAKTLAAVALATAAFASVPALAEGGENRAGQSHERVQQEWAKLRAEKQGGTQATLYELIFGADEKVARTKAGEAKTN